MWPVPRFRHVSEVLLLVAHVLCAGEFSGTVVSVQDGDTLTVLHGGREVRIRLRGIDCPEKGQAFGLNARGLTAELALGTSVRVMEEDVDRYGRVVATVMLADGRDLNREIVAAGLAWWYRKYAPGDLPA